VAAILTLRDGVTWIVGFLAAGVLTGVLGLILALPCLRVQSDFLGLVTIAFGSLFGVFATNWDSITGGPSGLAGVPAATLGPLRLETSQDYYELAFGTLLLVYLGVRRLEKSAVGRAWTAIREDEVCAGTLAIPVLYYKVLAFVIGSAIAGFAGAIYAPFISVVSPAAFNLNQSLLLVEMVIVGGLGSLPGSIVGAAIFELIPQIFQPLLVYQVGIGGAVMVIVMARRPQGLFGKTAFGQSRRRGPLARYAAAWSQRWLGTGRTSGLGVDDVAA
jgi:branched-chain amino acid transport system permease protein